MTNRAVLVYIGWRGSWLPAGRRALRRQRRLQPRRATGGENDLPAAEAVYARADELGSRSGGPNLGVLLEERGDVAGAEAAYQPADQRGDAAGAFNLDTLLAEGAILVGAILVGRRRRSGAPTNAGDAAHQPISASCSSSAAI